MPMSVHGTAKSPGPARAARVQEKHPVQARALEGAEVVWRFHQHGHHGQHHCASHEQG